MDPTTRKNILIDGSEWSAYYLEETSYVNLGGLYPQKKSVSPWETLFHLS
jgi:hypothetical protein